MSETTTYTKYNPTTKQVEFLNKLLIDTNLTKTDYSYVINFVNSIIFNHKSWTKKNS